MRQELRETESNIDLSVGEPLLQSLEPYLEKDDDSAFWSLLVAVLARDIAEALPHYDGHRPCLLEIGVCSKWLRPHQTRTGMAGGFAWPSGYGGRGYSRTGLPELDWSVRFVYSVGTLAFELLEEGAKSPKRCFHLRVAVPARTERHQQAIVHCLWRPGTPRRPDESLVRLYGFRHSEEWALVDWSDSQGESWK